MRLNKRLVYNATKGQESTSTKGLPMTFALEHIRIAPSLDLVRQLMVISLEQERLREKHDSFSSDRVSRQQPPGDTFISIIMPEPPENATCL